MEFVMVIKNKIRITYAPTHPKYEKERICGHTFEILDYYLLIKDIDPNADVKMIIFDKVSKEKVLNAYTEKYNLPKNIEKDLIFKKFNFNNINKFIGNEIWIITSGFDINFEIRTKFLVKKIISFECSPHDYSNLLKNSNFIFLRDPRLIHKKFIGKNVFDYNKKIYFKRYKKINKSENKILVYVNSFLKDLNQKQLHEIKNISKNLNKEILFISGNVLSDDQIIKYKKYGEILHAPVKNIFEKFNTFIYTPNTRNYDCSPRFIAECKFYNKKIISLIENDIGALARIEDLNNFEKINLTKNDLILKLIKDS
jgi:hypothetical protein